MFVQSKRQEFKGNSLFCYNSPPYIGDVCMARLKIYSTGRCPICDKTKNLLNKWNIPYEEARVDTDHSALREMAEKTEGARMVPQILIDV